MLWDLMKKVKKVLCYASAIVSSVFAFVPESIFSILKWPDVLYISKLFGCISIPDSVNITINRILFFIIVSLVVFIVYSICLYCKRSVVIEGEDFLVEVKYGDIFKEVNCKKVISFDECFTTTIGNAPHEIKESSICGQYLKAHPNLDIQQLITDANLAKEKGRSKYNRQDRYKSGTIVPNGDDLLLAFAPLDETGRGVFPSYKSYLDSLFLLWKELDKYYAQQDVCIPILGSGITRLGDGMGSFFSQQKLLEMIIESYKLSPFKLKKPSKLRIVTRGSEGLPLSDYL